MQLFNCSVNTKYRFADNRSDQAEEFGASANGMQDDMLVVLDHILNKLQEMRTLLKDKIIRMKINEIHRLLKQISDHSNLLKESNVLVVSVLQKLNDLKIHQYCEQTEQRRRIKKRLKRGCVLQYR